MNSEILKQYVEFYVPAHVEMMGLIGMGNKPMDYASVAVAVAISQA